MADPDLKYLRALLGDGWVDTEILGLSPTHLLGLWHKKNPDNPWVRHTEELIKAILTNDGIKLKAEVLAQKLKAEYVPTLAEMESAVYLAQQGFAVTIEPSAPAKGPDMQIEFDGIRYFVEVRAVGFSEEEDRVDSVTKSIFTRLGRVASSYHVHVEFGEKYAADTPELKHAMESVLEALRYLKEVRRAKKRVERATLYYASSEKAMLDTNDNFNSNSFTPRSKAERQYKDIADSADFIARFHDTGEDREGTAASAGRKLKLPPEPVNTHERLKKILAKKKSQLPKGARGILVLETSDLFMLDDFSIEAALYGDVVVEFPTVQSPGESVGEPTVRRNNRGFFRLTSRVSAVVIHKRTLKDGHVKSAWKVYPTNRGNPDTIQMTIAELRRFGDLETRENLSAENVGKI